MINDRYYRTFTFVRDPLSRILSAYLDKFNTENKVVAEYYKRWYGRYIMNTYQGGLPSKENENFKGTYSPHHIGPKFTAQKFKTLSIKNVFS